MIEKAGALREMQGIYNRRTEEESNFAKKVLEKGKKKKEREERGSIIE